MWYNLNTIPVTDLSETSMVTNTTTKTKRYSYFHCQRKLCLLCYYSYYWMGKYYVYLDKRRQIDDVCSKCKHNVYSVVLSLICIEIRCVEMILTLNWFPLCKLQNIIFIYSESWIILCFNCIARDTINGVFKSLDINKNSEPERKCEWLVP